MVSTQDVTLLSAWPSPFSMRVKLALVLKGISHEDLPQELGNKSKLLLDSNPIHKKVPVLIHKGKALPESVIIVEYIDEVWPAKSPLLPKEPFLRAEHRFWTDFIDKKILDSVMRFLRAEDNAAINEEFIENWMHLEGALQKLGNDEGPFFGGEDLSFLDVILAPYSVWIPGTVNVLGLKIPDETKCPRLHKWMAAISKNPDANTALPPVEKMEEFIHGRLPYWRKA